MQISNNKMEVVVGSSHWRECLTIEGKYFFDEVEIYSIMNFILKYNPCIYITPLVYDYMLVIN